MIETSFGRLSLDEAERVHSVYMLADNSNSMHSRRRAACDGLAAALSCFREGESDLRNLQNDKERATIRLSLRWLSGGWLCEDVHPDDFPAINEASYRCSGETPLIGQSTELLAKLIQSIKKRRAEGLKARGHVIWFSDGEATDLQKESRVVELKKLISELVNPVAPNGGPATQLVDLYAIPIGEKGRPFYEMIGIPTDHIYDVPGDLGVPFIEAMQQVSLEAISPMFEENGETFLRASREARKNRPITVVPWWPKATT